MPTAFPQIIYEPHKFQQNAIDRMLHGVHSSGQYVECIAGPTGTGKSLVELYGHADTFPHSWLLTPRVEIITGMLNKLHLPGVDLESMSYESICDYAETLNITTPLRFRNRLLAGKYKEPFWNLLDEGHHSGADTYEQLKLLCGKANRTALTASPYRGTPKSSMLFRAEYGEPYWMISYLEAWQQNYISMPTVETWPVVDDDMIEMGSNGDFVISRIVSEYKDKFEYVLRKLIEREFTIEYNGLQFMIEPTLFTVSSSLLMPYLEHAAKRCGFQVCCITDETPYKMRQDAFKKCLACTHILVHINTVSEGVDLPIRINIDLSPTASPVQFIQRFGRGTRPFSEELTYAYYICTNRNVERHGYLLDGLLPVEKLTEAQTAFPMPSERAGSRAFGMESLGRLKGTRVKLTNGLSVLTYNVTHLDGIQKREFFVIVHPQYANVIWFDKVSARINEADGRTTFDYGKWQPCDAPETLSGFRTQKQYALTDPQKNYWNNNAIACGIDREQNLDVRTFQIVPVLRNAGATLA
jgi:superfamily II DNA or RNA helicase